MSKELEQRPLSKLGRRLFLSAGSGLAALFALPKMAQAQTAVAPSAKLTDDSPISPQCSYFQAFKETRVLPSINGVAEVDLRFEPTTFKYNTPKGLITNCTRSWEGWVPGPTFMVSPGDRIEIKMENTFVGDEPEMAEPNTPAHFNTTNLHFHGLHVSPSSYAKDNKRILSSDDALYELKPREDISEKPTAHQWCVWLPEFHAPGSHWYHAHIHGATGLEVASGIAGAIVVREPSKELNMVGPTEDKVWLIQEVIQPDKYPASCSFADGEKPDFSLGMNIYETGGRKETWDYLVNGVYRPTIEIKAGQTQRWRFINATGTPGGFMTLKLAKASGLNDSEVGVSDSDVVDMYLVAVDGISFYGKPPEAIGPGNKRQTKQIGWKLAPGNRADFLVNLPAGCYKLIKDLSEGGPGGSAARRQVLAIVEVQSSTYNEKIPETVPGSLDEFPYLKPIADNELRENQEDKILHRHLEFSRETKPGKKFLINGVLYEGGCANIVADLGTAEEWTLVTSKSNGGSYHPFHIHVNPFQLVGDLIDPNGLDEPSNWRWWDTIAVPKENITIRNRFCDYGGEFVVHCHILTHEDQGMMMNIVINDPDGKGAKPCWSLRRDGTSEPSPLAQKAIEDGATVYSPAINTTNCTIVSLQ